MAEPGADLVDRQALAAQLDDAGAGGVLLRRALAPGYARRREHGELACPQVAYQGGQRGAGAAGGGRGLLQRCALIQAGAQRLVAPLVHLAGAGEQLPARARGRYGGHVAGLPQGPRRPAVADSRTVMHSVCLFAAVWGDWTRTIHF